MEQRGLALRLESEIDELHRQLRISRAFRHRPALVAEDRIPIQHANLVASEELRDAARPRRHGDLA